MALKLITPPTLLAVSLQDAKLHLRVDVADDDDLITAFIRSATEIAEQKTGRAIMPQIWELSYDEFPIAMLLTRAPVVSVDSLQYWDAAGVLQTLGAALYSLDNADDYGFASVMPALGASWPSTQTRKNAVVLRYRAGYADAASVPDSIKAWIKLQVGAMYENRQSEGAVQTYALGFADRLLDRFNLWSLGT